MTSVKNDLKIYDFPNAYEYLVATGEIKVLNDLAMKEVQKILDMGFLWSDFGWFYGSGEYTGEKYEYCETLEEAVEVMQQLHKKVA